MFTPVEFYRTYMVDYFLYKQAIYKNILDNYEELEPKILKGVNGQVKADVVKTLKSSIRLTYYHCIETLFEIVFALDKGIVHEKNHHQDELILQRLSNSDFRKNFKRIEDMALPGSAELAGFDKTISLDVVGEDISILRYIFYYTITQKNNTIGTEWWDRMPESLEAIKLALVEFAKDFSDRTEYNAYKHGLRVLPLTQKFEAWEAATNKKILNLDFSDAMTFLAESKEEFSITTKNFDTERDYRMTMLASQLIANIVNIRKSAYSNPKEEVLIMFFHPEKILENSKKDVSSGKIKINWRK